MQDNQPFYKTIYGSSPLVAAAIHDGQAVRENISHLFALTAPERLREEDPCTAHWTSITDNRIIGLHSRFELDLNRPREKAIYQTPEDAWGLQVWREELPEEEVRESLKRYDHFYESVKILLTEIEQQHGSFIVYDLHTYNHKREGTDGPEADPAENPEINIGTGNMNREKWAPVVDAFTHSLRSYNYRGRHLDVRENVKFKGGHFMRWIHDNFPDKACVLSIEVKKFFMDEWTGKVDREQLEEIKLALQQTVAPVMEAFEQVHQQSKP
ncbi:N-formylglutamate amidohydrolase [Pontibacter qinzhouensis]|uniref:N-formylglutamate amidohydrolase n=1 Tax=Pontibacter qinzhouensis TaxID=2603253 RepID=A0A5C8J783_9BACT|nr:N-formylglutamate amidohydrolase [Pontibacter qinzhouensis]TXK33740.1 N-formylglutamate amidohydrolase [Pontibacter qinzhouensis]